MFSGKKQLEVAGKEVEEALESMEDQGSPKTLIEKIIFVLSVLFALFFLYTAFQGPFVSTIQRGVHVCGGLIIWALYDFTNKKNQGKTVNKVIDVCMVVVLSITMIYYISAGKTVLMPTFKMSTGLYILSILFMLCVMEAARRTIGLAVPILGLIGISYGLLGNYIPGVFGNPGFKLRRLMEIIAYTDRGILGNVTGISATIIATFVIFGSILFATGGGNTFINLASLVAGNSAGGAAKMASVASGLFGMISGSSAANVATTGAFTIPMMKRMGYSSEFAGAAEASASSGGQIMPPIMGAGAFIMADMLSISYQKIALAAIIPSFLFYFGVIWGIDCYSKRYHYMGIPRDQLPAIKDVLNLKSCLPVFLPIGTLIALFFFGYTAVNCASYSLIVAIVLYLGMDIRDLKNRIKVLIKGLAGASKDMLSVISLIACSQILICMISVSGVGVKFTKIIVELGGNSILLAGLCAMVATMILGMGMPTVAAYILAGSVIAPAMVQIGIAPLAAHFFVFYYAIFAGLTPPVCGTVFVAAAMADSNWVKTAMLSIRLSIGAFFVPFMLIFDPAMILLGTPGQIIRNVVTSTLGITVLSAGFMGYFTRKLNWPIRILMCAAGCALMDPRLITDLIGIPIIFFILGYLFFTKKKSAASA